MRNIIVILLISLFIALASFCSGVAEAKSAPTTTHERAMQAGSLGTRETVTPDHIPAERCRTFVKNVKKVKTTKKTARN